MAESVKLKETATPSSLITYLYIGHFLVRWGARMWEFSVGLYMINIWPDSLLYAAIYGAVESASTALFGPLIGTWIDKLTYVKVLQLWLVTQNLSFIIAGATVVALLVHSSLKFTNFSAFILLVSLTNICGGIGVLSNLAGTILIEREWLLVISEGQPPKFLAKLNSVIRCIDLSCKLLAPVITGFIISFVSLKASAIALALWNTVAVWVEYWLFTSVYNGIPALGQCSQRRIARLTQNNLLRNNSTLEGDILLTVSGGNSELPNRESRKKYFEWISEMPYVDAWRVYLQQQVVLPGLALALLYFTVLSFGTLMTATLDWEGIPAYVIGIGRGISALFGICATVVFPLLRSHISTIRTELWSIWSQWICLLPSVAAIWIKGGLLSSYILMGSVALSRIGLWMFDLSVLQQMQNLVPESDRLIVGGVQNSLQSLLDLLAYVMGIIISDPRDFWKLILLSFLAVTLAALLYRLHVYHVRRHMHIFHFDRLLKGVNMEEYSSSNYNPSDEDDTITMTEVEVTLHISNNTIYHSTESHSQKESDMEESVKLREPPLVQQQQTQTPSSLITHLYIGHFLVRWGARMWEFSVGLYMINIWPDSLLYAAIYGAVESASTALFGPLIGTWIDKLTYVKVLQLWLVTQNLSFIIAGATVVALLVYSSLKFTNFSAFILLVSLTNISGGIGVLSNLAGTILIEREWLLVISEGQPPEFLTKMNSIIRRIDLSCRLLAPVITGFIISFVSLKASAIALALWNTVSVWVEYWLFTSVYNGIPALAQSSQKRMTRLQQINLQRQNSTSEGDSLLNVCGGNSVLPNGESRKKNSEWISENPYIDAWRVYLQQQVVLPGIALALLYFTVLSFGTLMTATLHWEGIPAYVIGIGRGISASFGIAATVVYPMLQSRISTIRTQLWSIWSLWICLLPCAFAVWIKIGFLSSYILMGSVAMSRLGLWMFDLSVLQQMQNLVPESDRLIVGGVQNSLQSLMDLLAYVMGIIISDPREFWKLTFLSFLAVTLAVFLYCIHGYLMQKHIFHSDRHMRVNMEEYQSSNYDPSAEVDMSTNTHINDEVT